MCLSPRYRECVVTADAGGQSVGVYDPVSPVKLRTTYRVIPRYVWNAYCNVAFKR